MSICLILFLVCLFQFSIRIQVSRPLLTGVDLMRSQCKAIDSKSLCLRSKSEKVPPATCTPLKANAHYSHTISLKALTEMKALAKSVFSHLFVYIYRIHVSAFDARERANAAS